MSDTVTLNGQSSLPETMQTKTSEQGTAAATIEPVVREERPGSGPMPPTSPAAAAQQSSGEPQPPLTSAAALASASGCTGEAVCVAPVAATAAAAVTTSVSASSVTAVTACSAASSAAAPMAYIQDPEFIKAINVLRKYSDSTIMSSVGGSMSDATNGSGAALPPTAVPQQAGDNLQQHHQQQLQQQQHYQQQQQQHYQQQQMPYGSPTMRPTHYTQLGSAVSSSPSAQYQRMGMPLYEDATELDPRAGRAGNSSSEYMSAYPGSYYDNRRYYHTKDGGTSAAAAAAAAASYMRRQSSTMVTDDGFHHSDQLAMFRERPMRPGVDNFCYVARRRSTYPMMGVCDVMEEVEDFKYRLPEPFMYQPASSVYSNGMDHGGTHGMAGGYRHAPHNGGYDGGSMLPALEWSMYQGNNGAGGSSSGGGGGPHDQSQGGSAIGQSMPAGMSYRALLPPLTNGNSSGYHSAVPMHNGAAAHGQSLLPASGGENASSRANGSTGGSAGAAGGAAAAVASAAGTAAGDGSAGGAAVAAGSSSCGTAEQTTRPTTPAGSSTPPPSSRKRPASALPDPSAAIKRPASAAASESSPANGDSASRSLLNVSSSGGVVSEDGGKCGVGGKKPSKQAAGSETPTQSERTPTERPPLETAALRPRKSCMGSGMNGSGQLLASAAAGTTPDGGSTSSSGSLSDVRRKASPTWDVGAIVWARLSGERWWPAMTIEGRMALQKPAEGTNCWVFWYGDHKVSEIPSEKILWFANNFHQRFSSSGGKIYKKAVAEALQECIRRAGCSEAEQAPIAEDNEHLRSCARQLFEQKGVTNIDKTPGTVSPVVAEFLRVIVSRIPAGGSPSSDSSSSGAGKKASSAAAAAGDDAAEPTPPRKPVSGKAGGSQTSTPTTTPKAAPVVASRSLLQATVAVKPTPSPSASSGDASVAKSSPAAAKPAESSAKKPAVPETPLRPKNGPPRSPASTASTVSSNSNGAGGEDVKAEKNISRQQYRALHGKQLDDFFNEVRAGKRSLDDVCIACNAHRKPVVVQHPLIHGGLCGSCKSKVMDALFSYGTDGCNVYCVLCGEGGDLLVCGLHGCGKTYCRGCIETLGSPGLLQRCLKDNVWACFTCSEEAIVTKDRKSLIVRRPNWQACISALFERPNSVLHKGPSASDFKKKRLRVLSLFDGISTGKVVVDKLGFDLEVYYASEIDPDSLLVTQMNHGDSVVQLGDVCLLTEEKLAELGRIDLLIGGSPCNDLSLVNPARKGIYDGSGVLFFEFYRILQTLISRQPGHHVFWLFENVVAMRVETKETICRFLECEPVNFNAGYFSAQNRARYFWGNIPGLYTPLNPDVLEQNITLQSVLTPGFNRKANVHKLRTVTTRTASLKQGHKEEVFPVTMNGQEGRLWPTELELVFGIPRHYTDVGTLGPTKRQKLLGRAWCVPVVEYLLTPLKQFFLLKEGIETAQVAKQ